MFICVTYPISECILKTGTLATSVFGSSASATRPTGFDALFERSKTLHQVLDIIIESYSLEYHRKTH